ncbi:Peptidase family M23 [Thermoanaerobacter thermohydrosulfuricus]|uniref:Peptidase family M23 n=1 Tax=Thermoanaerobacter thermohydrosulfuricus TaxID=1516 RepID=A0A1G7RAJ0_THETY|nr:M23 family metallopeptidase [Thermoanaerobacter thermohydrosulfuricus]SDG07816.1 Peptidase family M23 [Thermoanaerobacter thermohydrosulfuricus]
MKYQRIPYYSPKKFSTYKKYAELFENQLIISLVLLGMILLFKVVDVPIANSFINATKSVLSYDMNYENTKKGLKLVQSKIPWLKESVIKVFSPTEEKTSENKTSSDVSQASIKMISPVTGKVTSGFGMRVDPITNQLTNHTGIDIDAPIGTEVKAALDGVVMLVEEQNQDFGKVIVLRHANDVRTVYAHLSEILVKEKDQVKQGDIIGKTGDTGKVTAPHLHFEVWENGKPVDPLTKVVIGDAASEGAK